MCFTPAISLTTAVIEFLIAFFILFRFRKSRVNTFFVALLFVLGFYQFTEFMLCSSGNAFLWAKIGFITYTFLPAMAFYFIYGITNPKSKSKLPLLVFIFPVVYSLIAVLSKSFIIKASCNTFFVEVRTALYSISTAAHYSYIIYYFGLMIIAILLLWFRILKEKNKISKEIEIDIFAAAVVSLFPAVILLFLIPSFGGKLPSVYCEFGILFAIAALIAAILDKKRERKKKK